MDLKDQLSELLRNLEKSLICHVCKKRYVDPVRIKSCGHYFCKTCLEASKSSHNCPQCNKFYEIHHLDNNSLLKFCEKDLTDLKYLLGVQVAQVSCQNDALDCNIIFYEGNEYHVTFLSTMSKTNFKGETPLHLACKRQKFDEVEKLINAKVDINSKDHAGWTPLHEAVQTNNQEIIKLLLENHCLTDVPGPDYETPLHQAASLNHIDTVELLLKYGANNNMINSTGLKPEDLTEDSNIKSILKSHVVKRNYGKFFDIYLPGKMVLYCHSIDNNIKHKLKECKEIQVAYNYNLRFKLIVLQVVEKLELKTRLTHFMIKRSHQLSFKIMQAMLEGYQFLTEESANNLAVHNYFIDIPNYTFMDEDDLNKGIQKAMMSSCLKLPKLFEGINFYILDHKKSIIINKLKVTKEYLSKLITAGGGKELQRAPALRTCETELAHPFFAPEGKTYRCCNYIIYQDSKIPDLLYKMDELQHRSSKWLIDCVIRYEISE
ncbi:hypothetical protein ABEB36_003534 [Hypothenemus hampei]|uniref:Uncharacterized protein n=1 Tax=Hypothenemus hampei TaxID=57062 RepID=A0ABD1F9H8_HYPHA